MEKPLGSVTPKLDRKAELMNKSQAPVSNVVGKHADFQPNRGEKPPKASPVVKKK